MLNFTPNLFETPKLTSVEKLALRTTIRFALQHKDDAEHILSLNEFDRRMRVLSPTKMHQAIRIFKKLTSCLALRKELEVLISVDEERQFSCPIFGDIIITMNQIRFSLSRPLYELTYAELDELLEIDSRTV